MRTLLVAFIDLYQRRWAERYAGACRFEPSCSEYARGAIRMHGAWLGSILSIARLLRCRSGFPTGNDPVPNRNQEMRSLRGDLVSARKQSAVTGSVHAE